MKFLLNFFLGITFGFGLILSDIFNPKTTIIFLSSNDEWTYSVLLTFGSIIVSSTLAISILKKFFGTENGSSFFENKKNVNPYIFLGAITFGIGWGLTGLCVSTAAMGLAFNEWEGTLFFIFMVLGFYCPQFFKKILL